MQEGVEWRQSAAEWPTMTLTLIFVAGNFKHFIQKFLYLILFASNSTVSRHWHFVFYYQYRLHLKTTPHTNYKETYKKLHCKKRLAIFPSPAGMSLIKLSLAENNLFIPGQAEFGQ
jgi:hypothetical protein